MRVPPKSPRTHLRLIGAAAAVILPACGGGIDSQANEATPAERPAVSVGRADAPKAFVGAVTLAGSAFDSSSLAGNDAVAWFWAPWCVICRSEAPEIADVASRYSDQVTLFGVAGRGELDAMADFVSDTGTEAITHVADLDGSIWNSYGIYGQPAFAFIDDDGSVEVFIGSMGGDALAERIDALIAT